VNAPGSNNFHKRRR